MWRRIVLMLLLLTAASFCWAQEPTGHRVDDKVRQPIPPPLIGPQARNAYGEPILIAGTETIAELGPRLPRTAIEFRLGPAVGYVYGFATVAPHDDGVIDAIRDPCTTAELNDYSGGCFEVAMERHAGLFLEGGRVTLHEPLDVLGSGDSHSEYWSTAAGFELRL